ncbi:MAG: endonuclease V [Thermodesulfobacteria bacterium]|nr:endonuclease V [Thermodesulfobacteriota bacterium]
MEVGGSNPPISTILAMNTLCFYAFLDVAYQETTALAVAIITKANDTETIVNRYWRETSAPHEYVPGKFFKRELPCILRVLDEVKEPLEVVFIDAYVWLPDGRPGLGAYLFESLGSTTPVVGIAKNRFYTGQERHLFRKVYRGKSRRPLYVTAAGMGVEDAAQLVTRLAGPFRIPSPVKAAHSLAGKILNSLKGDTIHGHQGRNRTISEAL